TIHCYEAKLPLEPDNVGRFPTLHVRCGTNFLLILFVVTLILFTVLFSAIGRPPLYVRVPLQILAVPVIVGIPYEGIRLGAGRERSAFVKALMKPGLWLQMLTTKPPTPDMLEAAIRSLEQVLPPPGRVRGRRRGRADIRGNRAPAGRPRGPGRPDPPGRAVAPPRRAGRGRPRLPGLAVGRRRPGRRPPAPARGALGRRPGPAGRGDRRRPGPPGRPRGAAASGSGPQGPQRRQGRDRRDQGRHRRGRGPPGRRAPAPG